MPVYEYECSGCKKVFEIQQRLADAPVSACPECGGDVKKLISMSSFQLKGGGWYVDDYGYRKGVTEDGAASTSSSAASDGSATPSGGQAAEKAPTAPSDSGTSAAKAAPAPSPTTGAAASAPTKAASAAS